MKKKFKISLAWQIVIGLVLGVIVGAVFYQNENVVTYLQPLGTIFLNLIKMIVVPIIVSTLIVGVAGTGDMKQLGRLGGKTLIYFEVITTIAIVIGILAANIFQPGAGINMNELQQTDISTYVDTAHAVEEDGGPFDIIVGIVPTNVVSAMASGNMLAIIFFSGIFA